MLAVPMAHCCDRLNIVPPEDREQSPSGDWFVRNSRQRGLLPEILEELLAARKRWGRAWAGRQAGAYVQMRRLGPCCWQTM